MLPCYIIIFVGLVPTIMVKSLMVHCNINKRCSRYVRRICATGRLLVLASSVKMRRDDDEEEMTSLNPSSCTEHTISDSTAAIQRETARWIENAVLRMNLCPFAFQPIQEKKLSLHVWVRREHTLDFEITDTHIRSVDSSSTKKDDWVQELNEFIVGEMIRLNSSNCTAGETSIIVVPELYPNNFRNFLSYVAQLKKYALKRSYHLQKQKQLPNEKYQTLSIQIAPFHPLFEFVDSTASSSSPSAVRNLIQQSPYPMIHLLRQNDLDAALDTLDGDTSKVWQRNADLMDFLEHKMGGVENVRQWIKNGSRYNDT